jgi:hypothetical protein
MDDGRRKFDFAELLAVEMFGAREHFWLWVCRAVISCAAYPTQALEPRSGHAKLFLQQP